MALVRWKSKQSELRVTTEEIAKPASHRFYTKVTEVLVECEFERKVEHLRERLYGPAKAAGVSHRASASCRRKELPIRRREGYRAVPKRAVDERKRT
jgi:hypothetical protein